MEKRLFLAFEGIDGCGKSTQVKMLAERLTAAGFRVWSTFEPTDSPIGSMIRDIFSHKMEADHRTIAGLFVADRLDHLLNKTNGILKKLDEGYTVITDRYYFSSYAYHGAHMPLDWVIEANSLAADLLRPDLNIYLDITPEIGMQRLSLGRTSMELFETLENQRLVKDKYTEVIRKLETVEKIFSTDGNRHPEKISADIWNELLRSGLVSLPG